MSPRKYDMGKRAAAVEQTRGRIVDATRALHHERGIASTSWDDIAARAGVGVGTVYRHFPSADDLIPACGRLAMEAIALPEPTEAEALFAGVDDGDARIDRLVRAAFGIYERGAADLRAARREPDVHPAVGQFAADFEASLAGLIEAALEPLDASDADRLVVRGLLDLGTWDALCGQALAPAEAVAAVSGMLSARLAPV